MDYSNYDNGDSITNENIYNGAKDDNVQVELYDLDTPDDQLVRTLVNSLDDNITHWNTSPFNLGQTDEYNTKYMNGDQLDDKFLLPFNSRYMDNRIFAATRSVLAYVNARIAMPEVMPSKSGAQYEKFAQDFKQVMFQHGADFNLSTIAKTASRNLIVRKRAFIKLRFDPNIGKFGEIIPESIDPADIVIDRFARFGDNPRAIYHRQWCNIEELVAKFPDKKKEIFRNFDIRRGTTSQLTRRIAYYECWFTYMKDNKKEEGLCWFLSECQIILGKMKNPNYIYSGDGEQNRQNNITDFPVKPFVPFNYINSGKSYIDETSLFDQARPLQDLINKRGRQIWENADYVNGRVIADSRIMSEEDAAKFLNKNPKTIMLVDGSKASGNINSDIVVMNPQMLPTYVIDTLYDARSELDQIMGTPNIFRGQQQQGANTLGENMLIKQQAGALQDDLANAVDRGMSIYYRYLAQMMKVYYTEDHWIQVKGPDGKYDFVVINSDNIDTGVKISVQGGSTLPQDKDQMRAAALELAKLGPDRIDNLTLYEMLGIPDATMLAERVQKSIMDPQAYMKEIEEQEFSRDADIDIALIINNQAPMERDDYEAGYIEYFNKYITLNKFTKLPPDAQQRIMDFLQDILDKAARTANLQTVQANGGVDEQSLDPMAPPGGDMVAGGGMPMPPPGAPPVQAPPSAVDMA